MKRGAGMATMLLLFAGLAAAAAWLARWNEAVFDGPATAIDGDSLRMFGEELRLAGVDAPELDQTCQREGRPWRCGQAARAALERETRGGNLRCTATRRDRYGRWLVTCRAGGADVAAALVRQGAALAYGAYEREEAEARDARRGLWASSFERPDSWRRAHPR
ncbi:MAG: thermonuclease family protein [Methylobacteriaceae bacterium]|nr:thermonuclease family protein [Methylobacteriaceae bacterium]